MASCAASPRVSVIVAAYNAASDLPATLESVRRQTLENFEVLIVDDGSSDTTAAIAEGFAARDSRFRVIRQENAGVGGARNTGIRQARGEFIAPLDSDDLWEPEKLAKQVEVMERSGPEVGLVYCWSRRIDDHDRLISYTHPYCLEGRIYRALLLLNVIGNGSVPLFRASALADVGLYLTRDEQNGAQGCEDWDLTLRVSEKNLVRVASGYLVGYRQKSTCMSVNAPLMGRSYRTVIARARARTPEVPDALFRWSAGTFYTYLASKSYLWGHYDWTLEAAVRAVRADPLLLLSKRLRRFSVGSLVHLTTGGRYRKPRPVYAPTATTSTHTVPAIPQESAALGFLDRVQLHRWMTACSS
jgi:glycosyltransferase involved in cell wall biosynthesis